VPSALTPELALRHLGELSTDVRAAVLLDAHGELAAGEPDDRELAEDLREVLLALLESADSADDEAVAEVEVATPAGAVFVVRARDFALGVVTDRSALSSLIRYDLRRALAALDRGEGQA
jgi:predicted regulator of Ras-like GTPase activity (Roadblock/LC7/MglB family)